MATPGISERSAAGYLLLGTTPTPLALPSSHVGSIMSIDDWREDQPPPFDSLLAVSFLAPSPIWVLLIHTAGQPWSTTVTGRLQITYITQDSLLPMPKTGGSFSLYNNVLMAGEVPTALVIDLAALQQRHRQLDSRQS